LSVDFEKIIVYPKREGLMDIPKLTLPLTVDFGGAGYWTGNTGPFHYGAAVTAFFCEGDLADNIGDGLLLMRALEDVLRTFGGHLQPYTREREASAELFLCPEKGRAECSVCFAFHPIAEDAGAAAAGGIEQGVASTWGEHV